MSSSSTTVNTLKINRGTYSNIQSNIDSIGENELVLVTDKAVPIPTSADNGKVVSVNSSGEYVLQTPSAGGGSIGYEEILDYNVTVTFTNSLSTSDWVSTKIYSDYTVENNALYLLSDNQVGSIASYDGTTTVQIPISTSKLFILGESAGYTEATGTITPTNATTVGAYSAYNQIGISFGNNIYIDGSPIISDKTDYLLYAFSIDADNATITIQYADWYD